MVFFIDWEYQKLNVSYSGTMRPHGIEHTYCSWLNDDYCWWDDVCLCHNNNCYSNRDDLIADFVYSRITGD